MKWSGRWDSNPQQSAWKAETLAIELHPRTRSLRMKLTHSIKRGRVVKSFF